MSYQTIMDRCNGQLQRPFAADGFEYAWDEDKTSLHQALNRIKQAKEKEINLAEGRIRRMKDNVSNESEHGKTAIVKITIAGHKYEYQIVNGTAYNIKTDKKVVGALEKARINNIRIRIFYGNVNTGESYISENDIVGYVGRKDGAIKFPLLLYQKDTQYGFGILDQDIVKITTSKTVNGRILYEHPKFHAPEMLIKEATQDLKEKGYHASVFSKGENVANFKTDAQAQNFIAFIKGETNRKKY
jgi:hypothetical protein